MKLHNGGGEVNSEDEWRWGGKPIVAASGLSVEQFLRFFGKSRTEYLDGYVVRLPMKTLEAQDVENYLFSRLQAYCEQTHIGKIFWGSQLGLKLTASIVRRPSLFFVAKENLHLANNDYFDGAADIVIEAVQIGSEVDIYGKKFIEYENASVREYWIFDRHRENALIYRRGENGMFQPQFEDNYGKYVTPLLPKFFLPVSFIVLEERLPEDY